MTIAALAHPRMLQLLDLVLRRRAAACGVVVEGQDHVSPVGRGLVPLTFLGPPQCRLGAGLSFPAAPLPAAPLCGRSARETPVYEIAARGVSLG